MIISFIFTIKTLDKVNLQVDDLFLSTIVSNTSNIKTEGISSIVNYIIELDFFNPVNLLEKNYKGLVNKPQNVVAVDNSNSNIVSEKEEVVNGEFSHH